MAKQKTDNPAQIALQVTWRLKGDLKRQQRAYLRIGELLVQVRDEKLWQALKHESIESWAQARLGLGRTSLYRYLQVYDWVKERHGEWLGKKPKGFIPELSDVTILRAIETQLDGRLSPERRKIFEALRRKALAGELTQDEYARAVAPGPKRKPPLRAFADDLRGLHARAKRVPDLPPEIAADLASIVARLDALLRSHAELARISPAVRMELAALGLREFTVGRA
jgi:hypothetical protein